jgi:hypothetical protein
MFRSGALKGLPGRARGGVLAKLREQQATGNEKAGEIIAREYTQEQERRSKFLLSRYLSIDLADTI